MAGYLVSTKHLGSLVIKLLECIEVGSGAAQDLGFGYSTFFKDEMFLIAAARCATLSPATQVA